MIVEPTKLPDPVKEAEEFDSGWDADEFKQQDEPPVQSAKVDDEPAKVDDPSPKVDDEPPVQSAKVDDPPPNGKDYVPSYQDVVDQLQKTDTRFDRIETLIAKTPDPPAPKQDDDPTPQRVDLSEFTGEKLKSRLEKVRDVAPEAAEAFEPIIEGLAGALGQSYKEVDTLRATGVKDKADSAQVAVASRIETKHADWKGTVSSKKFKDWLGEQPNFVQRVAQTTDDPEEFSDILDQFAAVKDPDPSPKVDDPPPKVDDPPPNDADEESRRVRLEAAKQPEPKVKGEKPPMSHKRALSPEEEFASGWNDPEFDVKQNVRH